MHLVDLERIVDKAQVSAFRLETLRQYLVPQEDEEFTAWKRGERSLSTPETNAWLARIQDTTAAGFHWSRAHIIDYPLAEYSTYELHGYQANAAAGEHIYIADRRWHPALDNLREDFWIFDDKVVVRMVYDDEGYFLYPEAVDDVQHYLGIRATAMRYSVPLMDFLRQNEPRLIE